MGPVEEGLITVTVVGSPQPGEVLSMTVTLPTGTTVGEAIKAIAASGVAMPTAHAAIGIWGKPCSADDVLRDRDRVELYRPLLIDPKEARRARQRKQTASR